MAAIGVPCVILPQMPSRVPRLAAWGAYFLAASLSPRSIVAAPSESVGFVLSITGRWTSGSHLLQKGEGVQAGSKIVLVAGQGVEPGSQPQILVILFDGTHLLRKCDTTIVACAKNPLSLPTALGSETSLAQKLLAIAARLFLQQPERYFEAISRSGSPLAGYFTDSIVARTPHDVDLTPLFSRAAVGRYRVEAIRIVRDGRLDYSAAQSLDVVWRGESATIELNKGLAPGLYDINIFHNEQDDQDEAASDIWLLVTDQARFATMSSTYASFLAESDSLTPVLGSRETQALSRAALSSLAAQSRSSDEP
jgi:hypothetical protein